MGTGWNKARGWKKRSNISIGRCPGCTWKIWPSDKVARHGGKTYHEGCAPEETKEEEKPKPKMQGWGGWRGYQMFPTNKPDKKKRDYSRYYPDP